MKYAVDIKNYWGDRKDHDLYRLTRSIAKSFFSDATSGIDVGCYIGGLICDLDWIPSRIATDLNENISANWADVEGVEFIAGDAFSLEFKEKFDLVLSNQTVEHVADPSGFIQKLLSLGRGLIVTTTYEVPFGFIEGHIQDPISLEKFQSWFPCELDSWTICHHPTNRTLKHIVGVVKQSHPNRYSG